MADTQSSSQQLQAPSETRDNSPSPVIPSLENVVEIAQDTTVKAYHCHVYFDVSYFSSLW
jgi:hypothetical protein